MATRTVLVDDLDKGDADETVKFALDGTQYEIDLSAENAARLRELLEPYMNVARKAGRTAAPVSSRRQSSAPVDRAQNKAIREWARSKKMKISDRGRIPDEIVAEYHASAGR